MPILTVRSRNGLGLMCLVLLVGFSLLSTRMSYAQLTAAPMTAISTIERFTTISNGTAYVRLKNIPLTNPSGCRSTYWYALVPGNKPEGMSRMLATLLTARASELKIRLGISDTECASNSPKIVSVLVEPN